MTQPGELLDIKGATDPETISQTNTETIARRIWKLEPTYQGGTPNTITGPPTSGARVLNELWIDQLGATWICTVAGTPGTWKQLAPAVVDTLPSSRPTDYWVVDRADGTLKFRQKIWNGSSWTNLF